MKLIDRAIVLSLLISAACCIISGAWYSIDQSNEVAAFDLNDLSVAERNQVSCGPISLAICAQLSGVCIEPRVLIKECNLTNKGVSPDELERLAQNHGLVVRQVEWNWNQLISHSAPLMLHVNGTHFVAAHPGEPKDSSPKGEESIRVYEPSGAACWWSKEGLLEKWDGVAMLVHALQPSRKLQTASWWVDVGPTNNRTSAKFSVPLRNAHKDKMTLRILHSSCSCTAAALDKLELSPGDVGTFTASVKLTDRHGPFRERVRILSEGGGGREIWTITLAGTAVGEVDFSVKVLSLGDLRPSEPKPASIVVRDAGDASLRLVAAKVDWTDASGIGAKNVRFRRVTTDSASELSRKHPGIQKNDWLVSFDAVLVDPNQSGKITGKLVISGTHNVKNKNEQIEMTCPVVCWVRDLAP